MQSLTRRQFLRLAALTVIAGAAAACGPAATATPALTATPQPAPTATVGQATGNSAVANPTGIATAAPTLAPTVAATSTPAAPVPTGLGLGPSVAVTSNADFYSVAITSKINWLEPDTYALTVGGAVNQPLKLSLADLKAMPVVAQMRTLECISNPPGGDLISNANWKGVRLVDVLNQAGLKSQAVEIKLTAADGYDTSIPVSLATDPDALLVYEMNGLPLSDEHGAPLRCLFPGRYGMKQPKWITSIEAVTQAHLGHWERQGWSNEAIVRVNSQFRTPESGEVITVGVYPVSGTAFANTSGVVKVEVSTDSGKTWQEAKLVKGPTSLNWSEWRLQWTTPATGQINIVARATDGNGEQQPLSPGSGLRPDSGLDGVSTAARQLVTVKK